jgi:YHS domain-containing protein
MAVASAAVMALAVGGTGATDSHAQGIGEKAAHYPFNTTEAGASVGINGYDLVAYFDDKSATQGEPEHAVKYGDVIWYFANEEHQQMFLEHPNKYLPRFGGFCPVRMSEGKGEKGNPKNFVVRDGQLYFCTGAQAQRKFEGDPEAFVDKAEANAPKVFEKMQRGR